MFFCCFVSTATQVSPSELQDVFNETSSNIFQINANGKRPVSVSRLCALTRTLLNRQCWWCVFKLEFWALWFKVIVTCCIVLWLLFVTVNNISECFYFSCTSSCHIRKESSVTGNIKRYSRVTSKSVSKSILFIRVFGAIETCAFTHLVIQTKWYTFPPKDCSIFRGSLCCIKPSVNLHFLVLTHLCCLKYYQKTNCCFRQLWRKV